MPRFSLPEPPSFQKWNASEPQLIEAQLGRFEIALLFFMIPETFGRALKELTDFPPGG